MTPEQLTAYKQDRQRGIAASLALREAKRVKPVLDTSWLFGKPFTRGRFHITVTQDYDQYPDKSIYGKFVRNKGNLGQEAGAGEYLVNTENRGKHGCRDYGIDDSRFRWFRPVETVRRRAMSFIKHEKMGSRAAWELAWKHALEDARAFAENSVYELSIVIVHAETGIKLYESSICGIEISEDSKDWERDLKEFAEYDFIGESISETEDIIKRLVAAETPCNSTS